MGYVRDPFGGNAIVRRESAGSQGRSVPPWGGGRRLPPFISRLTVTTDFQLRTFWAFSCHCLQERRTNTGLVLHSRAFVAFPSYTVRNLMFFFAKDIRKSSRTKGKGVLLDLPHPRPTISFGNPVPLGGCSYCLCVRASSAIWSCDQGSSVIAHVNSGGHHHKSLSVSKEYVSVRKRTYKNDVYQHCYSHSTSRRVRDQQAS
jgi:hypothetical protein